MSKTLREIMNTPVFNTGLNLSHPMKYLISGLVGATLMATVLGIAELYKNKTSAYVYCVRNKGETTVSVNDGTNIIFTSDRKGEYPEVYLNGGAAISYIDVDARRARGKKIE